MFGHERGAFTGATQARIGRFELAHTGTLFLDEIGDLSLDAQAKLLRVIEAKEIQRVGGSRNMKVDVRVIAATNHDLARAVRDGAFREDLFFRLNVVPIALPPLRDRKGDVTQLVHHFSLLNFKKTGQLPPTWTQGAMDLFDRYPWPGNIRELANIVERMAIVHPGANITASVLSGILGNDSASTATPTENLEDVVTANGGLTETLDRYERTIIEAALRTSAGNMAEAARWLNTDRPNLYRRMKRLGIEGPRVSDKPAQPTTS